MMEPTVRDTLCGLIRRYGHSLCEDPGRCQGMLNDLLRGEHRREVFVLISALKAGIADELLRSGGGVPPALLLGRLRQRLEQDLAMTDAAAHWAVETWALALGVIAEPVTPAAKGAEAAVAPTARPVPETPLGTQIGRYRDLGDGTVLDPETGLQWMRCALGAVWDGKTCTGEPKEYSWDEMFRQVEAFNRGGGFAGQRDWRDQSFHAAG